MNEKKPNNDKPQWPLNSEVVNREFVKEKRPNNKNKKETKKAK
tara:strand:+ start:526 stop:654 length:129 start_codon:yes stop_codon:yes gene_type:complete